MLAEFLQTSEEFAWAGRFSTGELIAAGVALAVAFGLLARWQGRLAQPWLTPMLLVLRLVAVVVVLCMLAGPAIRTTVERTTPKALALMVDTSASMTVVDGGDEQADTVRWAAAGDESAQSRLLAAMDQAAVAIGSARARFVRLAEACCGRGRSECLRRTAFLWSTTEQKPYARTCGQTARISRQKRLIRVAAGVRRSVEAGIGYLEEVIDRLGDDHSATAAELAEIHSALSSAVAPKLASLAADIETGRLLLALDRAERLGEINDQLDHLWRRLPGLADELAVWCGSHAGDVTMERLAAQARMSRLERVSGLLAEAQGSWLGRIEADARTIRYRFDRSALPLSSDDWGEALSPGQAGEAISTDLAAALEQVARDSAGAPVEAAVLVTDGRHNADGDPLGKALAMSGLPIYFVPIGNTSPLRDVMLHHVQGPRAVFLNDLIVIELMVDAYACAGEELVVELLKGDGILDSQTIAVSSDSFVRRLSLRCKAEEIGMQEFHVRVTPVPDERVEDNNEATLSVEVTEDKIRVLLADHMRRWETRYLGNLFKRDQRVQFDELLFDSISKGSGENEPKPGFPKTLEEWGRYRVVILGDVRPSDLSAARQDLLEQYVNRRAGTLILIAGKESMPGAYADQALGRMLPVEPSDAPNTDEKGFTLFVTAEGGSLPVTQLTDDPLASERIWREQFSGQSPGRRVSPTAVHYLSPYSRPRATSHVLIHARPLSDPHGESKYDQVFLCWHQYGAGRVVYLSAPVTYLLRHRRGDLYHNRFWGQLLRWAIAREVAGGSKTVRLATDKTRYTVGEEVQATVRLNRLDATEVSGASCRVVARQDHQIIASEDLVEDPDSAGVYRGLLKNLPASPTITIGVSGADVQALLAEEAYDQPVETTIVVNPADWLEMRNTRCNLPLLEQIAESTGGLVVPPTGLAAAIGQLDLSPEIENTVTQRPLWTRWTCLWVFLGCLTAEWVVRKLVGLA